MAEHNREKNKLYQQKKREQAHLRLHQDPLAQLANIVTQQEYLQNVPEVLAVTEPVEEQEPIDAGITVEEDGEILEEFVDGEWGGGFDGGFPDEPETNGRIDEGFPNERQSDANGGFDGGFPDEAQPDGNDGFDDGFPHELDSDTNTGFDGEFPDEPESDMNDDFGDEFSDGPDAYDDGSQSIIAC